MQTDTLGRSLFLYASIGGLEVFLMAFYIPPPFQFAVLQEGGAFMAKHPTVPAIWLGDFNMTIDPTFDRLSLTKFGRFL